MVPGRLRGQGEGARTPHGRRWLRARANVFTMSRIKSVKGFRDFYPHECAVRNHVFGAWRRAARRSGFVEYEVPMVESTDLYRRKSGEEITRQLFCFEDKRGRELSLRPEITPSLARMAAARQRDFRKPLKWFEIGNCFRYEEPQRGRTREFYQFNADILGETDVAADAELVALAIGTMVDLGFPDDAWTVRLSDRRLWDGFLRTEGVDPGQTGAFLQVIDKLERVPAEVSASQLHALGTSLEAVRAFMEQGEALLDSGDESAADLARMRDLLTARGLWRNVRLDAGIVRGLAYYTGVVFEVFDLVHGMRAVAGGGRYDSLCGLVSGGAVDLPAAGFAMGDVVITDLIQATPAANARLTAHLATALALDVWVVIADETRRGEALALVESLRGADLATDYSLVPAKVGRQFQSAEHAQARAAVVVGAEYPAITVKDLGRRSQQQTTPDGLIATVRAVLGSPDGFEVAGG